MSNPSAKPQGRQTASARGYEKRDANAKAIFGVVVFVLFAGLIMHFCLAGVMERFSKTPAPTDQWAGSRRAAGAVSETKTVPHLQISPAEDLEKFREREAAELGTYGWINPTAGVVRIPIERAMDLVLERGLPVRSQTNASGLGPSSYQLQQQRPESPQPEIQGEK
jgi:hypothetical protein